MGPLCNGGRFEQFIAHPVRDLQSMYHTSALGLGNEKEELITKELEVKYGFSLSPLPL